MSLPSPISNVAITLTPADREALKADPAKMRAMAEAVQILLAAKVVAVVLHKTFQI